MLRIPTFNFYQTDSAMKRLILLVSFLFPVIICMAQTYAITQYGDKVILYDDFTWRHSEGNDNQNIKLSSIFVDSLDIVTAEFAMNGNLLAIAGGNIVFNEIPLSEVDYYDTFSADKYLEGKLKKIMIGNQVISFIYYDLFELFANTRGKIKEIVTAKGKIKFEYYDNLDRSLDGKLKVIRFGDDKISFEFFDSFSLDRNLIGKFRASKGSIPGIKVIYFRALY
jgi:hypothetical protein